MNYYSPKEAAQNAVTITYGKTTLAFWKMLALGLLAGAYIAFGAEAATLVSHDIPLVGISRLVSGIVFSAGLMMVIIAGAELFTGNILVFAAVLDGKVKLRNMLWNWFWIFLANFAGSLIVVGLIAASGLWETNNNLVGAYAIKIAVGKLGLSFTSAFIRGIACNWLVCLAVWMTYTCKDIVGKIFAILFPITVFVASNFEHSVANMYYIPAAMMAKANPAAVAASHVGDKIGLLNWHTFLIKNLVPVTLGNIVGGAIFVAGLYWFTYVQGTGTRSAVSVEAMDRELVAAGR